MFHEVGFGAEDAVPRIRLEGEDGADVAQGFVGVGEPVGQGGSVVQRRMGGNAVDMTRDQTTTTTTGGNKARPSKNVRHANARKKTKGNRFDDVARYHHRSELG